MDQAAFLAVTSVTWLNTSARRCKTHNDQHSGSMVWVLRLMTHLPAGRQRYFLYPYQAEKVRLDFRWLE